jgi:hypothetical protein
MLDGDSGHSMQTSLDGRILPQNRMRQRPLKKRRLRLALSNGYRWLPGREVCGALAKVDFFCDAGSSKAPGQVSALRRSAGTHTIGFP